MAQKSNQTRVFDNTPLKESKIFFGKSQYQVELNSFFLILDLLSRFRFVLVGASRFLKIFDLIIEDPRMPPPPINKTFLTLVN